MPRASSVLLFLAWSALAITFLQVGHSAFPGDLPGAQAGRVLCSALGVLLLVVGSRSLLRRDGLRADSLGLALTPRHGAAFLFGSAVGLTHILLLVAVLHAVLPLSITRGPLGAEAVALAGVGYLAGNFVEELLFRGYLLVALARLMGTHRAIWVLALPFGLFHFQGLDPLTLTKMMLTTGAMHFVYAYAFLAWRSVWAPVALHAVGNTMLHKVFGVDEPAFLAVGFQHAAPAAIDVPFLVFFGVTALLAFVLSRWPPTRRGASEYQLSA